MDPELERLSGRIDKLTQLVETQQRRDSSMISNHLTTVVATVAKEIRTTTQKFGKDVTDLKVDVADVRTAVASGFAEALGKLELLIREQRRSDIMNRAYAERMALQAEMRKQFQARQEIRDLAKSLVGPAGEAFVQGLAGQDLIHDLAAKVLRRDANYWLGLAALAVAAEYRGERSREEMIKAWSLAEACDPVRSNLFCALIYSRIGKDRAAAQSMNRYLDQLNPHSLGREFSQVVNALAERELGKDAFSYAEQTLRRWAEGFYRTGLTDSPEIETQIGICGDNLMRHHRQLQGGLYPRLRAMAGDDWWTSLEADWRYVTACGGASATFQQQLNAEWPDRHRGHASQVLRSLIDAPEEDELQYKRQIRRQNLILEDQAATEDDGLFEPAADFPTLLIQGAFHPGDSGFGVAAQQLALVCTGPWIDEAAQRIGSEARRRRPQSIAIKHGEWSGEIQTSAPVQEETQRLIGEVHDHLAEHAPRVVLQPAPVMFALGGLFVLAFAFVGLHGATAVVVAVLAILVVAASVIREVRRLPGAHERVRQQLDSDRRQAADAVTDAVGESAQLSALWQRTADQGAKDLTELLRGIAS